MRFYVYDLIDPRTDETFYVGKGQRDRVYQHEKDARRGVAGRRFDRIREIIAAGLSTKHVIVRRFEIEKEALDFEIERILDFPRNQLLNIAYYVGSATSKTFGKLDDPEEFDRPSEGEVGILKANVRKLSEIAARRTARNLADMRFRTRGYTWFPSQFNFGGGKPTVIPGVGACLAIAFYNMEIDFIKSGGGLALKAACAALRERLAAKALTLLQAEKARRQKTNIVGDSFVFAG